jgi:hypothetical protein
MSKPKTKKRLRNSAYIEYPATEDIKKILLTKTPTRQYRVYDPTSGKKTGYTPMSVALRKYITNIGLILEPREKIYDQKITSLVGIDVDVDKLEDRYGTLVRLQITITSNTKTELGSMINSICSYVKNMTDEDPIDINTSEKDNCPQV